MMKRTDGRKATEIRKVKITPHFMKFAEGSCLFEIGGTKVICTASIEEGVPKFLRGQGSGWITAEYSMLPRSCSSRVAREASRGKLSGRTQEIQRLIGRSMRSICDLKKLEDRTIWMDADVIQADGGTRCASISGCFVALSLALSSLKKEKVFDKLPLSGSVGAISVGIVKEKNIIDLNYAEDSSADVDMNIVMTGTGKLIEIQGTAEGEPFSIATMNSLVSLAKKGMKDIFTAQKKVLKNA